MRTARSWLGLAKRWTASGYQKDVEPPTTVLLVGQEESDDALLWQGSVAHFGALGFMPFVDCYVEGIIGGGQASANDLLMALITPSPASPTLLPAGAARFIRSPTGATPNAQWIQDATQIVGPFLMTAPTMVLPAWLVLGRPGLLVRAGEALWFSLTGAGALQSFSVALTWRGSS